MGNYKFQLENREADGSSNSREYAHFAIVTVNSLYSTGYILISILISGDRHTFRQLLKKV